MEINQDVLDGWTYLTKEYVIAKGKEVALAHKTSDRFFDEKLKELIALENFLFSIQYYDYSSDIFTDEELRYLLEQIGRLGHTCPKGWIIA